MTTYTLFQPPRKTPFQFQPTLDGQVYNIIVTWNIFGQRWYLNLYDLLGNRLDTCALVGSPDAVKIADMSWSTLTNEVTLDTLTPHIIPLGSYAYLTTVGVFPPIYNLSIDMVAVSPTQLVYPFNVDPGGPSSIQGSLFQNENLFEGYFQTSTFVYRESTMMFEVSP